MRRLTYLALALSAATLQAAAVEAQGQKKAAVSDAEIAAIVVAANAIDADVGDLAATKASSADVRAFGKTMATDHRAVNAQATELVTRLGVKPAENPISRKLKADAATFRAQLEKKSGAEFDRAYMTNEVAYHKAVLDAVDKVLIPNAANAELRKTLVSVRPAFVAHLAHAEHLQQQIAK